MSFASLSGKMRPHFVTIAVMAVNDCDSRHATTDSEIVVRVLQAHKITVMEVDRYSGTTYYLYIL